MKKCIIVASCSEAEGKTMGYRARQRNGLKKSIDWNAKLLNDFDRSITDPPVELLAILDEFPAGNQPSKEVRRAA